MIRDLTKIISDQYDADIYVFIGAMFFPDDRVFLDELRASKSRKNALLIIDTPGGSAEVAYRIGRAIQRVYRTKSSEETERGEFIIYVHELCKSAGTILSLAADRIIMSQFGELGPIDVQLRKDDEIGERTSGLTPHQALETLQVESGSHFQRFFRQLRFGSELGFSTKLSADIAAQMAVGLMGQIYGQIDPSRLGEVERHVRVSSEYGSRLQSKNVKSDTITKLAAAYPSHEFVIDRTEARQLFNRIDKPTDDLEEIWNTLSNIKSKVIQSGESFIICLSREECTHENESDEDRDEAQPKKRSGNTAGKDSSDAQSNDGQIRSKPTKKRDAPQPDAS